MKKKTKYIITLHIFCAAGTTYYFTHNQFIRRIEELKSKVLITEKQIAHYQKKCNKLNKKLSFLTEHKNFAQEQSARLDLAMGLTNEFIYIIASKKPKITQT